MPKPLGVDKRRPSRTLAQALGAELTDLRVKSKLNRGELAFRLGYNETYILRLEHGTANPSLEVLSTVSDFFHLTLSELIARAETRSKAALSETIDSGSTP